MSRYDRQIKSAARMIERYGQSVTWKQSPLTVADPSQPWKTTQSAPVNTVVSMIFIRRGRGTGLAAALYRMIKGTDVPTGAPRALMAQVPFTPELTDTVDRDGVLMNIATIDPVAPSGIPIMYVIEFR